MVKLAKGAKTQGKPKKIAPPKDIDDSEEEMEDDVEEDSGEELEVPVKKTQAKKAATPAKATPAKKAATPAKKAATPAKKVATPAKKAAKPAVTPGKKGATPAGAKNGKQTKKQDSEEEDDDDEEEESDEESEEEPIAKKPAAKKTLAKKEESEEEEDDDDEDESEEEAKPTARKPVAKKEEEEEEDSEEEDEAMEVAPPVTKGKKPVPVKNDSEEDEDDDDEEDDDDDDEEDDDEDEDTVKDSGKRKKEMPKNKDAPESKKQKTEGEGFSVYVANLNTSKDFDEIKEALREFFTSKNLTVVDVRLGGSKRFGYVDFSTVEEVEKALKLNGKKVLGFEMKVEKANSAAEKTKTVENKKERDARTLFVKNIPYSTTVDTLQEIFENAKEIRLPTGKDGSSKGIAYIEFNTEAEADKAIEEKQGAEVEGRSVFIDYTGDKSQNAGVKRGPGEAKILVVNNVSYSATEEHLQEVFDKATSIRIPQHQGRPKGFAFVEFATVEDAKEALENNNNTDIEGRTIRLEYSQGGGPQTGGRGSVQSKTLFVKGLSEDTTEETLKESFDGSITARIVTDRDTGASKGYGFVDFSSSEDAKAAKDAMEDGEIDGNRVTLDFAKPKSDSSRGGRGGFGGRGGGRGGFGGRGGGRGGFGGRGGGRGGFGGRGGGRGGFGGRGGGGFRGGNQGKKMRFDD